MRAQAWAERQEKVARGQCLCENLDVYQTKREGGRVFGTCACGHPLENHDQWGDCTHVDGSMNLPEKGSPENLEIGYSEEAHVQGMDDYTDDQMRQELIDFFSSWKVKDIRRLTTLELAAWKRHALELRRVGFWWGR
jgi:hypothetical protein